MKIGKKRIDEKVKKDATETIEGEMIGNGVYMDSIIDVEELKFGFFPGINVLKGIFIKIKKGENIVILGENGSGKSTFFLCLLNLIPKFDGKIIIEGIEVNKKNAPKIRKNIGYLFQDSNDHLFLPTVREEIGFGPYNLGLRGEELENRIKETMEELGLSGLIDRNTFHLSYGEKKRVAFATIYAMNPDVFLLDEPFVSLDPQNKDSFVSILNGIHEKGKTMLLVTHELEYIPDFFKRAIVMNHGEIIYDGSIGELYRKPEILKRANLKVPLLSEMFQRLINENVIQDVENMPLNINEAIELLKNSNALTKK